jgi:hypothetical protein
MTLTSKRVDNARSQSPRAQRRHFCDFDLEYVISGLEAFHPNVSMHRARQRNLLKEDLTPRADAETYKRIPDTDLKAVTEAVQNKVKENVKSFTHGGLSVRLYCVHFTLNADQMSHYLLASASKR